MGLKNTKFDGTYASILADGSISVKCEPNTPGAKMREYEDSQTHETKIKWEKVYTELSGLITKINFMDGDFGKVLHMRVVDGADVVDLGFSTNSNFGEDLMKKLPNVDFNQPIIIKPYSFDDKVTKKNKKGVSLIQGDRKITSYFSEMVNGKAVSINDIPVPEAGKNYDKDDWKVYFITVRKFLVNFIEENVVPLIQNIETIKENVGGVEVAPEDAPDMSEGLDVPGELSVDDIDLNSDGQTKKQAFD